MDARSEANLVGVHPDLVKVVRAARAYWAAKRDDPLGFIVTEGLRNQDRQRMLVSTGASQTLNSRHLTGHAVDLAATLNGKVAWDWPLYKRLADIMKQYADDMGVKIVWGGDWKTLKDGPHFELQRSFYP